MLDRASDCLDGGRSIGTGDIQPLIATTTASTVLELVLLLQQGWSDLSLNRADGLGVDGVARGAPTA
jgi:hypothetical protein